VNPQEELLKSMTPEQLEQELDQKIESFHGFLTREVALKLLAKEKGLLKEEERFYKVKEIPEDAKRVSLVAKVEKILPEVTYSSGKKSRTVLLSDETGTINLKLWEEGMGICSRLRTGSTITIRNAYERFGDLNLGYKGTIELDTNKNYTKLAAIVDGAIEGPIHIFATISKIEGIIGSEFIFFISDGITEIKCVIKEAAERGSKMAVGDLIIIDNARAVNGAVTLSAESRLLLKRQKNLISGKVEGLGVEDNGEAIGSLWVEISGKRYHLDRSNALRFLNLNVSDDISLETISQLKKESLVGSTVNVRVREANGSFLILE
jgi:hypothetical protein